MGIETTVFEPDRYFRTPAAQAHLLTEAMASGDAGHIAEAVGIVARQHGITDLAKQTGLNRQGLYAAFSQDGNPTLSTVLKVLEALNLVLTVQVREAA
jgi:probable addiction module antidote protein